MAVWQCDFYLLPEALLKQRRQHLPDRLSAKAFERIGLSKKQWFPADHATRISELLTEFPSWSTSLRWWGTEVGDRIDLFYKEGNIASFRIRLDTRRLNTVLIRQVLDIAAEWKCVLVSAETLEILRPTRSAIFRYLVGSYALITTWDWLGGDGKEAATIGRPRSSFVIPPGTSLLSGDWPATFILAVCGFGSTNGSFEWGIRLAIRFKRV